ncbi:MAG: DUF1343 domain-containing protein [Candidatus Marinimicrobia bacterium]|nr:DUF1343 domain-containing protein [Candidatus Neomarinimicrobiota bacterium]MCF7830031.1 DUF1343 domain-containing protein [Candidatus Neomarinimicrobiota bacterium]MCF7881927.1 DUF1343 domain-containing protein [Candidatus Neomarinimicrobiota bacterium]
MSRTLLLSIFLFIYVTGFVGSTLSQTEKLQHPTPVTTGMENLLENHLSELRGKSIGLIVNQTAVDGEGVHLVDRLMEAGIDIQTIFAPEHGYRGEAAAGEEIQDGRDPVSGARVYSLYGEHRKPTQEMLGGLDILLYDIQDVGVRFYTYINTMGYAMQSAAENVVEFWVLDRPNPISGSRVNGPMLQNGFESFVGLYPIPVRYGLTAGELAKMIVGEGFLKFPKGFEPAILPMKKWRRNLWSDETDIPWVAPSPNMNEMATAILYPGLCFIEGTNISEGRGTDSPFQWIGAPWISSEDLAEELNKAGISGVRFEPITFTPKEIPGRAWNPKYEDEVCGGVSIRITNRDSLKAVEVGVRIIHAVHKMYPEEFEWREAAIDRLYGSDELRESIDGGATPDEIIAGWREPLERFLEIRDDYLLYE